MALIALKKHGKDHLEALKLSYLIVASKQKPNYSILKELYTLLSVLFLQESL